MVVARVVVVLVVVVSIMVVVAIVVTVLVVPAIATSVLRLLLHGAILAVVKAVVQAVLKVFNRDIVPVELLVVLIVGAQLGGAATARRHSHRVDNLDHTIIGHAV